MQDNFVTYWLQYSVHASRANLSCMLSVSWTEQCLLEYYACLDHTGYSGYCNLRIFFTLDYHCCALSVNSLICRHYYGIFCVAGLC